MPFEAREMTAIYLDTSAAMKPLVEVNETDALTEYLTSGADLQLVSCWLLHTELHCAAGRNPSQILTPAIATVLAATALFDITRGDVLSAGTHAPLRSLDAIHLTVALRLGVTAILTYDRELRQAASTASIDVIAPR